MVISPDYSFFWGIPYIQTITGGDAIGYRRAYRRNGGKKKTDTYMEKSFGSMIVELI